MVDVYGTSGGFTAYHTARGRSGWSGNIDAALLVASEFIDARYQASFPGTKVGLRAQVREWPRQGVRDRYGYYVPSDTVPVEIENATYEAALRQLATPGALTVDFTPNKYKRASVDGAVSVEYATFSFAQEAQTQFLIIDQIIGPLLTGHGNVSMLSGATIRA